MLSIRAKLLGWYLGIAAAVLLAFAIEIYAYLSRGLLQTIDTSLWNQADRIAQVTGHPSTNEEVSQPGVLILAPQFVSVLDREMAGVAEFLPERPSVEQLKHVFIHAFRDFFSVDFML